MTPHSSPLRLGLIGGGNVLGAYHPLISRLEQRGLLLKVGTAVDATLIAAPSSTKNKT